MQIEKTALMHKTAALLEFDRILDRLAYHSMSEEASAIIRAEKPLDDSAAVAQTKTAVQAIISRITSEGGDPRRYLPSVGFLIPKLEVEGMILEVDEACAIGLFCERGEELKKWLLPHPLFAAMLSDTPDCGDIANAVFRIMDREAKLRDLPELRAIKRRIQNLNAGLEAAVSRYTADEDIRRMLQSTVPSQRDGRTVLAVKANFRGRIRGIVHEVSSSGQTIFIEPENVVEKNNEILVEQQNFQAEIRKIMLDVTKTISEHSAALKEFRLTVINIEILMAKARYSLDTGGYFSPDEESGEMALVQARHPLLNNAVPIDLTMDGGTLALIITGSNTGGKTVALKTAGIFAMMNQIGLALPAAAGTMLPVFDGVFADIGDEQSIGQSLSTFSAHITNIANIVSHSTARSLALLDELGSGTDPQEGSAIAMAILDRLIERKARLIITTHHGILKNYGYSRQEVENASVEFDVRTLSPTYRIITGIPGESRALEIAGRNGLPPDIIAQAKTYLDSGHSDVSALISGLKEKHRELDTLTEKTRSEDIRLTDERRKADLKELRLRQKELELKAGLAGKLRLLLDESRKTLENLVRELKEESTSEGALTREKTLKVKEFLGDLARTVAAEDAALEAEEQAIADEQRRAETTETKTGTVEFAPGMEVFAGKPQRRGILIRPDKKSTAGNTWVVEIGSLKISFPERELTPAPPLPPHQHKPHIAAVDIVSPPSSPRFEINLCGMRLDEALETLRRQIDTALLHGLGEFSVVHGKGDGILQKGVHQWLKQESAVADYYFSRPEMGGFGRTEVILKR
ncbi:MAG: Smr/MutS family protein [Treponema sp.]|jgi:DNA mismatch repair protein MutS2|nr:Smr/MutS family protein [Treponema sp.]